jgi:lathosterol oxidase
MDTVLHYCDQFFFDSLYAKVWPAYTKNVAGSIVSSWPRDDFFRINLSIFMITCGFGWLLYLVTATLSYYIVFDHDYMKHPKFLKNQVRMEIECAVSAIPWMTRTYFELVLIQYCILTKNFKNSSYPSFIHW